jgi:hypothetical protein
MDKKPASRVRTPVKNKNQESTPLKAEKQKQNEGPSTTASQKKTLRLFDLPDATGTP